MSRLSLLAAVAICTSVASAQDLYDTSVLRNLDFTFHDANWWTLLQQNYVSQTNILADLVVEGVTYPNVGVRIRGNTSYTALPTGSQKVSLNVEMDAVDANQTLMGFKNLNLNNAFHDPTFCREVAYSNFLSRYIPNGRANHVTITLNGANWGVYTNIQQWDKTLLRDWFEDEDGARFKCANNPNGPGLRYNGATQAGYTGYELKDDGGLADPWATLIGVCNSVTNEPLATWQNIDSVFAIDPSIWSVALENLFSDDDSYVNKGADFVLYRDPTDGRMHLQQTDGNESFSNATWSPTLNFTSVNKPVLSHVLAVPELRQRYMAHMRAALTEFNWTLFNAEFSAYRTLIDAAVQADPKKLYSYTLFQSNFTSTVTLPYSGPAGGNVIGLQAYVNQRAAQLSTNAEVSAPAPAISNVSHTPTAPAPTDSVWVRATVTPNVNPISKVELFYRPQPGPYARTLTRDDGLSNDGAAGDGVYGALLPVSASAGQRIKYYVAATSSNTYGSMTFYPALSEIRPLAVEYTFGSAGVRVTEFMYSGTDGEFFELTNMTASPIDLAGWSMDDDSATPGGFDLSAAGVLAPGQSIVVTDVAPSAFSAAWSLSGGLVLGPNSTANLGRNDQINIYDANDALVERLDFGDQNFPGAIRTQNKSGQTCSDAIGTNTPLAWSLAAAGDVFGSHASTGGDLGTPGTTASVPCNLPLGFNYCTAFPNVSGGVCGISAVGSPAAASQNVTLHAASANSSVPGLFLYGHSPVQVPLSFGNRCVGGGIVRVTPNVLTGAAGDASLALDFNASYATGLSAGATLYFQFWYRDNGGSNLSNGLRIDFH